MYKVLIYMKYIGTRNTKIRCYMFEFDTEVAAIECAEFYGTQYKYCETKVVKDG